MKRLLNRIKDAIVREQREGECMPAFYGVAWEDFYGRRRVCLPIPFNVMAAILRSIWLAFKYSSEAIYSDPRAAYRQGIKEGERRARDRFHY